MKPLKTETEVQLKLISLESYPAFAIENSDEYMVEAFFASSHTATRCFRIIDGRVDFSKAGCNNQMTLKSIVGSTIELWLTLAS